MLNKNYSYVLFISGLTNARESLPSVSRQKYLIITKPGSLDVWSAFRNADNETMIEETSPAT